MKTKMYGVTGPEHDWFTSYLDNLKLAVNFVKGLAACDLVAVLFLKEREEIAIAVYMQAIPWVVSALLPLCSLAANETICCYEGASVRQNVQTCFAKTYKFSATEVYALKHNCGI